MRFTPKTFLLIVLATVVAGLSGCGKAQPTVAGLSPSEKAEDAARANGFTPVDLDAFIEQERAAVQELDGKKVIRMAVPVSFEARLKRHPEQKELSYIYTALGMSGISPLPEVEHRMFVESAEGQIIPVYVEKQAAAKITKELPEETSARFLGYHAYSYDKGPAILVVDCIPLTGAGKDER
ncbi:MAG: hypothetical protein Q7Q73_02175 [Verrucomicrobiota bacterium JB024]|nr:hypothetical protein [Verrucomicrobiota bacterium JB024]